MTCQTLKSHTRVAVCSQSVAELSLVQFGMLHAQQPRVCCSSDKPLVIPFAFPAELLASSASYLNSSMLL